MDAADLRIFETVARAGAMSRAAVELNTVQSNVTARVRSLEGELGTPLFTRSRRGVALTDAGRRLLPYAERLRTMLVDARRAVRDDGAPTGPLTLGTLETTAALRLARPLARFTARWPDVDLALRTGTTAELVGSTLRRDVEGAFVCGPVDHPDLVERGVFRETLAVVGGPALRSIEALRAGRETRIVVLRAGCSYRQRLEDVLARRGVVATRTLEFGTIEAMLACVAAGIGVTLLPRALVAARTAGAGGARGLTLHALPAADADVATVFIRRRDAAPSRALDAFISIVGGARHPT